MTTGCTHSLGVARRRCPYCGVTLPPDFVDPMTAFLGSAPFAADPVPLPGGATRPTVAPPNLASGEAATSEGAAALVGAGHPLPTPRVADGAGGRAEHLAVAVAAPTAVPSLFDTPLEPTPAARASDPPTSHAAAAMVTTRATAKVWRALYLVQMDPAQALTHYEIGCRLADDRQVTEPEKGRRVARTATDLGLLARTGETAPNRNGGAHGDLYALTDAGLAWFRTADPHTLKKGAA